MAAHSLLNASAVVMMGITTLQDNGSHLRVGDRERLLERMYIHAARIDDVLRDVIQG